VSFPVAATEIILVTGERYRVEGSPKEVEASILAAARGSIMEFVWLTEVAGGKAVAVNPDHVAALRATEAEA
jgi:hypothetical protein